jgi:hypothetical protein
MSQKFSYTHAMRNVLIISIANDYIIESLRSQFSLRNACFIDAFIFFRVRWFTWIQQRTHSRHLTRPLRPSHSPYLTTATESIRQTYNTVSIPPDAMLKPNNKFCILLSLVNIREFLRLHIFRVLSSGLKRHVVRWKSTTFRRNLSCPSSG